MDLSDGSDSTYHNMVLTEISGTVILPAMSWRCLTSDPVHPALSNRCYNGQIYLIDISGDLLFLGTDRGFEVLSLANPGAPARLGYDFFPFLRDGSGLSPAIDGDTLYLGWSDRSSIEISIAGMMGYSISDPASPRLLAHYERRTRKFSTWNSPRNCAF